MGGVGRPDLHQGSPRSEHFRWSRRMGICGSSGMTINGDPKLACATFLADYLPGPVRVEPMRNFPVIRDLKLSTSALHGCCPV